MYGSRAVDRSRAHVAPVDVHCICSCWFQSYVRLSSGRPLETWAYTPATTFTARPSPVVRGRPNAAHRECPEVRSHCWFRSGRPLKHTLCCDVQLYPPCYWCTTLCAPVETSPSDVRSQSPGVCGRDWFCRAKITLRYRFLVRSHINSRYSMIRATELGMVHAHSVDG